MYNPALPSRCQVRPGQAEAAAWARCEAFADCTGAKGCFQPPTRRDGTFGPFGTFPFTAPPAGGNTRRNGSLRLFVWLIWVGWGGGDMFSAGIGAAMRRSLVELLACPECRGAVEVAESREENAIRILQGTLRCTSCARAYPIDRGVPRLVKVADDMAEVCRRFSFQWLSRWNGRFESSTRCYGFNDDIYIGWVNEQLQSRRVPAPGEWMLDAGCGSGEKTKVLARLCPEQNVVGLDLGGESLEKATAQFGGMPHLD